ncbi:hypothetical protein D3C74_81870 [compost metagenome]
MNVTIFFTRECNLKCSYCYEGEKFSRHMSLELLQPIVSFLQDHMKRTGSNRLNIVTHGGEPMLAFPQIQEFVQQLKLLIPVAKFFITTNGTIMNETMLGFLSEEYEDVSISIDGTQAAHDMHRVFSNQRGSYDRVRENSLRLLERRPDTIARMTVTSANVRHLYQGVVELSQMGFQNILPVPDEGDSGWNEDTMKLLLEECKRITTYLHNHKTSISLDVGFINDAPNKTKNSACDGGTGTLTIDTDGKLYPCTFANGIEEFCIGDIFEGIHASRLAAIHAEDDRVIEVCEGCQRYEYCTTTRCKIINKVRTGDYNVPTATRCCLEHLSIKSAMFAADLVEQH